MNNDLKHNRGWLIHLLCWGILLFMPLIFTRNSDWEWSRHIDHFVRFLGSTLAYVLVFYTNYLYLVPRKYFVRHKKPAFFWMNALLVVAAVWLTILWGFIFYHLNLFDIERHGNPGGFGRGVAPMMWQSGIMMVLVVALALAVRMAQRWNEMENKRHEAEKARSEAELNNLRNQLNPHFLLNTLNNIYALIAFNPEKAQTAVHQLSKLLRHMLYDNQNTFVPLCKETAVLRNYIELMKIRIAQNVSIDVQINVQETDNTPIAPLLFISLVENAFKHGVAPSGNAHIHISINSNHGIITCEIRNSNHPKNAGDKSGSGIGLAQVQKRLDLLYPNRYTWQHGVTDDNSEYYSIITIDTL